MSANKRRWTKPDNADANMKRPVIISLCVHIFIFAAASMSFTFWKNEIPETSEIVMTVDLMDFAEMPTAPVRDMPDDSDKNEPAPPKKPTYNTSSSSPDLLTPQEPELSDVPMPDAEKPDKPVIKKPPKPKNKPKPKPKPAPKAEEKPKEEPKEEEPQIDNLLRSVLNETVPNQSDLPEDRPDSEGQTSQIAPVSEQLLSSMEAALNNGVKRCWNVNAGGKYAEEQKVQLEVFVNRDRTVREVRFVDTIRYNTDTHYRAAADAARRALLNRNCWPLNLPEDKYEIWKSFIYTLDPSGML